MVTGCLHTKKYFYTLYVFDSREFLYFYCLNMYGYCGPLVEVNVVHFGTTSVKLLPNGQGMEVKNTENDKHPGSDHPQLAQ